VSAVWLYGAMYYYVMHVHALFEPASHTAIQQTRIVTPPLYLVCTVYSSYITYTVQSYSTYTVHLHTPPLRTSTDRLQTPWLVREFPEILSEIRSSQEVLVAGNFCGN